MNRRKMSADELARANAMQGYLAAGSGMDTTDIASTAVALVAALVAEHKRGW